MNTRIVFLVICLLRLSPSAFAHRLNEYLQATTIDLSRQRLTLQVSLTAGEDVARKILAAIDMDGDGAISDAEQKAYAEQVHHDLSLMVDGNPASLRIDSFSFPAIGEIIKGAGIIQIRFIAGIPAGTSAHRLTFQNRHQRAIAVYLVNCLLPVDSAIIINSQSRNYNQSFYQLNFTVVSKPNSGNSSSAQKQSLQSENEQSILTTYIFHGIRHILAGYDHLLFLCALVLAATSLWELIKIVTAFTLAHSITLTLAVLDLVHVPGQIVEPLISASIVFVALQNIFWQQSARGRSRLAVAFFFGLFHGLGFAGALLDIMQQMQRETVILAILGFTIGIEVGNQIVLFPLFSLLKVVRYAQRDSLKQERLLMIVQGIGSVGIALGGIYYLFLALTGS